MKEKYVGITLFWGDDGLRIKVDLLPEKEHVLNKIATVMLQEFNKKVLAEGILEEPTITKLN